MKANAEGSKLKAADIANKESVCCWNQDMYGVDVTKGGQDYYDSIVKLYTSWGLDFIKADDMFGFGENGDHNSEIDALGKSIEKYKRPIVLSLSPGTRDTSKAEFLETHAQMWRISGDFWDRWVDLKISSRVLTTGANGYVPDTGPMATCCRSGTPEFVRNAGIHACRSSRMTSRPH